MSPCLPLYFPVSHCVPCILLYPLYYLVSFCIPCVSLYLLYPLCRPVFPCVLLYPSVIYCILLYPPEYLPVSSSNYFNSFVRPVVQKRLRFVVFIIIDHFPSILFVSFIHRDCACSYIVRSIKSFVLFENYSFFKGTLKKSFV